MIWVLVAGVAIWSLAHFFKRMMPQRRAGMGNAGKGIVAIGILVGLGLMIWGYRGAAFVPLWYPPDYMVHINNLLMLIAVFVYGMSATTGRLRGKMRHPQLTAVVIWAVAHLLVNGDVAALVLFGGLLLWAVAEMIVINRAEPVWDRPPPGNPKKDILLVVITIVMFGVITAIHAWLGVWPFPR
ncbi:NnrU family protein [Marivita sp. GX14005]|uniref:NnrU family protein n=1 Tax=Marivita sp. GX14005 TaxID=2942276 RepID=UPI002018F6BC|nr:NnrU family protein [Marivita sp. GX14005]MCL3882091.1 NnrU family protein [Marivita sp. GX14005]